MNNNTAHIEKIKELRKLSPKAEVFSVIDAQVARGIDAHLATHQGETRTPTPSPYASHVKRYRLIGSVTALCLLVVTLTQAPHHSAYHDSLRALAETQRVTEAFEANTIETHDMVESLSRTRDAFNSLSLDGTFGLYTEEQCRTAYTLYDSYLDYTLELVDEKIAQSQSEEADALTELRDTLTEYRDEAAERIQMYP